MVENPTDGFSGFKPENYEGFVVSDNYGPRAHGCFSCIRKVASRGVTQPLDEFPPLVEISASGGDSLWHFLEDAGNRVLGNFPRNWGKFGDGLLVVLKSTK